MSWCVVWRVAHVDTCGQVEACTLSANFKRYSQQSAAGDEVVLTRTGFLDLMHSLGVGDDKVCGCVAA